MKLLPAFLFLLAPFFAGAADRQPFIQSDGEWSQIQLMDAERLIIRDYELEEGRSVVLSILQLLDRHKEEALRIDDQVQLKGATIRELGGGMCVGYRDGNLEIYHSSYLIEFADGVTEVRLEEASFVHLPEYFPYITPYPVALPKVRDR